MVEQRSPKPTVEGSSPSAPANEKQRPLLGVFLFLGLLWLSFRHFLSSFLLSFCPFLFSSLLFFSLLVSSLRLHGWFLRVFAASKCAFFATSRNCMVFARRAITGEIASKMQQQVPDGYLSRE